MVLAAEVAVLIHLGNFTEKGNAGGGDLLDGNFQGRRVQFCQELVTLDFRLFFGDGALAFAWAHRLVLAQCFDRAVRLNVVGPIPKDPGGAVPVSPCLYLRMLNTRLHSQPSGPHVKTTALRIIQLQDSQRIGQESILPGIPDKPDN